MASLAGIEPALRESKSRALTITLQATDTSDWVFNDVFYKIHLAEMT